MQLPRHVGAALLLLALGQTVRADTVPPQRETGQAATLSSTLDRLWMFVDDAVSSIVQSVAAQLDGRLAEVETRLASQLGQLYTQLDTVRGGLETELRAQNAEMSAQSANLTRHVDNAVDELSLQATQLSSQNAELLDENEKLAGRLSQLGTELRAVQAQLKEAPPAAPIVRDCSDLPAGTPSGVHLVRPGLGRPVPVFCDQDTDGGNWTVLQRRADVRPRQDFFLDWQAYKWGFGDLEAEFWWGLEHLWLTTSLLDRRYELRIDMEDFDGERRRAVYQGFRIASEDDGYRLTALNYTGDATDSLSGHSGQRFSTKDRDHDTNPGGSCANSYTGAWWYTKCHNSNLNGQYLAGKHDSYANGVNWQTWKGYHYSLKTVTMKIRPTMK